MERLAFTAAISSTQKRGLGVRLTLRVIRLYQLLLSPFIGMHCRFHPSCSCYAEQAFIEHGFGSGLRLSLARLARCHPWHPGGADPVPKSVSRKPACS